MLSNLNSLWERKGIKNRGVVSANLARLMLTQLATETKTRFGDGEDVKICGA